MASNDSRQAAIRWYRKLRFGWLFNTSTFLGNLLIAMAVTWFFRQLGYGDAVDFVFLIMILAVGLWITEAIPPFAVGILIIALLLLGFGSDYIISARAPVEMYLDTWTSNVIWLLLGGFFLAQGMQEAGLDKALFAFAVRRFGHRPEALLRGLMFVTAIGSMVMSNTATTAMMISSILPLVHLLGRQSGFSVALLTGIPAAATVGGIGTIIGSTPNAIAIGALQERGQSVSFLGWMLVGLPVALFLVYVFYRYICRHYRIRTQTLDLSGLDLRHDDADPVKRRAVGFTLLVTVGLWLTEPLHGIPVAATSAVPIVLLTLTRVIGAEQVRRLPWDTLMLVAGGLALGLALSEVGLTRILMDWVNSLPLGILGVTILFSLISVLLSNVMSNTAASAILVPLATSLPGLYGLAGPVIVAVSCSCALMLPVSTPSNAVAFATGLVEQRHFRRGGLFFVLAGPATAMLAVMLWAWLYFR
jgi:solute carrier family 13 (sodium-dependent dicarboxylate transporter), member 2/3/5